MRYRAALYSEAAIIPLATTRAIVTSCAASFLQQLRAQFALFGLPAGSAAAAVRSGFAPMGQ
jgi:hypothetical protein